VDKEPGFVSHGMASSLASEDAEPAQQSSPICRRQFGKDFPSFPSEQHDAKGAIQLHLTSHIWTSSTSF
jgi:hypothetical protein